MRIKGSIIELSMSTGKWTFNLKKPEGSAKLSDPLGYNVSTANVVGQTMCDRSSQSSVKRMKRNECSSGR